MQPLGNTAIYQEIAKKKFPYSKAGQTVNFFGTKKQLKLGNDINASGKSYILDTLGVSYIHWRNRHIYLQSESMIPIKLQEGSYQPSSRLWYQLFELGLIVGLHKGASTAPTKQKNSNFTMIILIVMSFAIGYFVALFYGQNLSPALYHPQTTTIVSNSVSTLLHSSSSITTSTHISNSTTTTVIVP